MSAYSDQRARNLASLPGDATALGDALSALAGAVEAMRRNLAVVDAKLDRLNDAISNRGHVFADVGDSELSLVEAAPNVVPLEDVRALHRIQARLRRNAATRD